jgi:oligo-1,6-glucosidase
MTVAEGAGVRQKDATICWSRPKRTQHGLSLWKCDIGKHISDLDLKIQSYFSRYDEAFKDKGWLSIFLITDQNGK